MPTLSPTRPARTTPAVAPAGTAGLAALVAGIAARPELWRPQVRFDATDRWWTRLDGAAAALGAADTDVWLLTWLRSQGTELHDHGSSAAAFTVVSGALTEWRHTDGRPSSAVVADGGVQTVEPGVAHDVGNTADTPAVSIHAYSPRLTRMTYYRRAGTVLVPVRTVVSDQPER